MAELQQYNAETSESDEHVASCQDCHVPTTDEDGEPIQTRIARNPHGWDFPPRTTTVAVRPSRVRRWKHLDSLTAPTQHAESGSKDVVAQFDRAIEATRKMLRNKTARIEIDSAKLQDQRLDIAVSVTNLTGHKLPTAYPSRRVWIRLQVRDANGDVVFESGQFDNRGRILGGDQRVLSSEQISGPTSPHLATIASSEQVQIYESVMQDANGETTYSLLRGASYRKDNRILPLGWKRDHSRGKLTAAVAVDGDNDFVAGTDVTQYVIDGIAGRTRSRIEVLL